MSQYYYILAILVMIITRLCGSIGHTKPQEGRKLRLAQSKLLANSEEIFLEILSFRFLLTAQLHVYVSYASVSFDNGTWRCNE